MHKKISLPQPMFIWVVALFFLSASALLAAPGHITTVAGGHFGNTNSLALIAPWKAAADGQGNLHVFDWGGARIYKVNITTGDVTHVVGTGIGTFDGDGLPGTQMSIRGFRIAADTQGNAYFSFVAGDSSEIRKIDPNGNITKVASNLGTIFHVDRLGNIYTGTGNILRKLDATTGNVTVVAGTGENGYSGDGGPATDAQLRGLREVNVDGAGNIYMAEQNNHVIRKVDTNGIITTLAGNGTRGYSGDGGPATEAQLAQPRGVFADDLGNVYIADYRNHRIRKVDANGIITTIAGGSSKDPHTADGGPALDARILSPPGLTGDGNGNLFVVDRYQNRVRKIDLATGIITTVAGGYMGDGQLATQAALNTPRNLFVDTNGDIYLTDRLNGRVRKINAQTGIITTVAGGGTNWGNDIPATERILGGEWNTGPGGVVKDSAGNLIISGGFERILRLNVETNTISLISDGGWDNNGAGTGDGAPAMSAQYRVPDDIALDSADNIYIADSGNNRIRKIDAQTGMVSTVVGGSFGSGGDGGPATDAQLATPAGIFVDANNNLYIADSNNHRIRKVDATTGMITTVAGSGESGFDGDGGPATQAKLNRPYDTFVDAGGNIFIADYNNNLVRKVDANGIITTVAGNRDITNGELFFGDNQPATESHVWLPTSVFVDQLGHLYITSSGNERVYRVESAGTPTHLPTQESNTPTGTDVAVAPVPVSPGVPNTTLNFDQIVTPGVTTIEPVEESPSAPQGFKLGDNPLVFDINTTAVFNGAVELCISYDDLQVFNEANLKLFHFENGAWTDITTSVNTAQNIICGSASSFSLFAVAKPEDDAPPPLAPIHRTMVSATVTQNGAPVSNVTVSFGRSISGLATQFLWSGTTDTQGNVQIEIVADAPEYKRTGANGYYQAKATGSANQMLSVWHSIPISGGKHMVISLPMGDKAVIESQEPLNPLAFGLSANHPNPFNPATTILYQLSEPGHVSLTIYNALGQQVRTLVNNFHTAGQYRVVWNSKDALGRSVSSGVYFYRLISNNHVQTKRMMLLK